MLGTHSSGDRIVRSKTLIWVILNRIWNCNEGRILKWIVDVPKALFFLVYNIFVHDMPISLGGARRSCDINIYSCRPSKRIQPMWPIAPRSKQFSDNIFKANRKCSIQWTAKIRFLSDSMAILSGFSDREWRCAKNRFKYESWMTNLGVHSYVHRSWLCHGSLRISVKPFKTVQRECLMHTYSTTTPCRRLRPNESIALTRVLSESGHESIYFLLLTICCSALLYLHTWSAAWYRGFARDRKSLTGTGSLGDWTITTMRVVYVYVFVYIVFIIIIFYFLYS